MDIGYLTFWGAKSGESITEGYAANLEEVAAADEIGMDSVWVGGVPLGGIQPLQIAPAIAARTRRIRIGTAVHLPHLRAPDEKFETEVTEGGSGIDRRGQAGERYRYVFENLPPANPIQVAEQIAIIDQVSNGRFIYGAGGNTTGDERRQRHFQEYLEVMKQIWTEEQFSGYRGEFFDYPPLPGLARINPKPVQKPHPPILLPIDSQQSFVAAGRSGYHIAIGGGSSHNERGDAVLKQDVKNFRQAWKDAGHAGEPKVVIRITTHVAATQAEADSVREAAGRAHIERMAARGQTPSSDAPSRGSNLVGTPAEVVDRIHELEEDFGANEIMCTWMGRTLSREDVVRTMRVMADEVMPKVK
jgi:alkanesulfonate monooxygenase SsuD/methylene tetrahydromethanopterin reductase-like flavin-dependent oxidoreductase (luciferase family)